MIYLDGIIITNDRIVHPSKKKIKRTRYKFLHDTKIFKKLLKIQ